MTDTARLQSLVQRSRNRLWGRRFLRTVWYGCCAGALVLLMLALIHILFVPVPVSVWLPCLAMPVAVAALYAVLRQRPSCAHAAAALDRAGAHNDLLVSAWEMLAIPPGARPAGAGLVLRQAGELCARTVPPRLCDEPLPWRGSYGSLTWITVVVALFLLQLSTPQPGSQTPRQTNNGSAGIDLFRPRMVRSDDLFAANQDQATAINESRKGGQVTAPGFAEPLEPSGHPLRHVESSPANKMIGNDPENANADAAIAPGAGTQSVASDGASAAPSAGPAPPDSFAPKFEDIARTNGSDVSRLITGTGVADFDEPLNQPVDAPPPEPAAVATRVRGGAHSNLFSVSQRLQIEAYFDSLEETP